MHRRAFGTYAFYFSYPGAMVVAMAVLLKSQMVSEDKIMLEIFPGYD